MSLEKEMTPIEVKIGDEKSDKVKKSCDNAMVCFDSFSKFLQFWLNLRARTQQIYSKNFFFDSLTPLRPLGARPYNLNRNSVQTGCVQMVGTPSLKCKTYQEAYKNKTGF